MKKGDTIQGRPLYKRGHYSRKYGKLTSELHIVTLSCFFLLYLVLTGCLILKRVILNGSEELKG